uniref:Hydroxysteroid 17-beta dehydrogenase 4 n=1 Tax=Nephromyces sp. MMRI TaxID=2496275 RepID=A0A3S8V2Z2_9APIC|nr:hydroxysteroid 17-beta dehydrogenase 4 [Nephromyces sp. MMRI]
MSKPEKIIPSLCEGFLLSKSNKTYNFRDTILYAIGVGASQDSTDILDLKFTYENSEEFSVIPSFVTVIPNLFENFMSFMNCPGIPEFDPLRLLHGEHKITLHKPIPSEAQVHQIARIETVEDKKSGALIKLVIETYDQLDSSLLCSNVASLFLRGLGGFDNKIMHKKDKKNISSLTVPSSIYSRPPDYTHIKTTSSNQAIIYRLLGDYNPLHIDPNVSQIGGFNQPILHGLCTFGIATHGIVKAACKNNPQLIHSIAARFSSPVTPGDQVKTEIWRDRTQNQIPRLFFRTQNLNTGKICIDNGLVELAESISSTNDSKI